MEYEKKFEYALIFAGFLIVGSIGLNYLGFGVLVMFFSDYSFIAYSALVIGIIIFFVGILLAIAILIISRRSEGKKIFSVKKDPLDGVIGIGLGLVGSISMMVGVIAAILYSHGYIATIMWPALGIFGVVAYFFEERGFCGLMLIMEGLLLSLIVISPLLGLAWSGEVFEYFLILFGVIFATLGGLLIYIREFF